VIAADAFVRTRAAAAPAVERWAVAKHTFRSTHRGALIWGLVFGLFVFASAIAFILFAIMLVATLVQTRLQRRAAR